MALKGRYRLIIKQGPVPGKVFEIAKQVITIGRDVKSDFVVNDAEVSRSHTRLTVHSDGCLVEDLASTNGSFVNGQRITTGKMIRPGDVLGLGETVLMDFVFVPDAEATVIAPPMGLPPEPATPARGPPSGPPPACAWSCPPLNPPMLWRCPCNLSRIIEYSGPSASAAGCCCCWPASCSRWWR